MHAGSGMLRSRGAAASGKVGFIELFFDLVFVFAVTQLSHGLIAHFSLLGALQTLMLMLAVWWVWIFTAWVTNWLDPEARPVRVALMVLMLLGLILSSSIPQAFDESGLAFAGAYVCMQVGRTLFFLWAVRGHAGMVRNFQRILAWLSAGGALWLAGALTEGSARMLLWGCALGVEYLSPSLGFHVPGLGRSTTADWDVEGAHMAERCGLFIIIALGESILVTGATFSGMPWSAETVAAFVVSFVGSLAMWWLYFDTSAEVGSHRIAHSQDPGRLARLLYTYIHLFLVAGIIVLAVADEFVLAHPLGHSSASTVAAIVGGTALYLVGNWLFRWALVGRMPRSPLIGALLTLALVPFGQHLAPLLLMGLATAVIVAVAIWEARTRDRCLPPELQIG